MKSAQTMRPGILPSSTPSCRQNHPASGPEARGRCTRLLLVVLITFASSACSGPRLTRPATLSAPYESEQLWAIAPPLNESGVSVVDTARIADAFQRETQQVEGIDTLPVNRVINAMRLLGIKAVTSHADALTLLNALDADGLIVGTVTAYDPYRPMTLGVNVQLYRRDRPGYGGVDARQITRATSGHAAPGEMGPPRPVAQAAGVFDAKNHGTLRWLEAYAAGRNEPDGAYGKEIYLVSMDLYTEFVCHRLLVDLLENERSRLTPMERNQVMR